MSCFVCRQPSIGSSNGCPTCAVCSVLEELPPITKEEHRVFAHYVRRRLATLPDRSHAPPGSERAALLDEIVDALPALLEGYRRRYGKGRAA